MSDPRPTSFSSFQCDGSTLSPSRMTKLLTLFLKGEVRHPLEKAYFCCLFLQFYSFGEPTEKDFWTASKKFWHTVRRLRTGKQCSTYTVYSAGDLLLTSTKDIVKRRRNNSKLTFGFKKKVKIWTLCVGCSRKCLM